MKLNLIIGALILFSLIVRGQDLPQPEIVTPAENNLAPSDAVILFDGSSLDHFASVKGGPAPWKIENGILTVAPGTGNIHTNQHYGDCQLHLEWKTPSDAAQMEGQKSGNSGIYMMGKYEVQVLNSYQNETYPDGQAGAIYKQHMPMVNASRAPGEWQVYDIIFKAPRYNTDGSEKEPGYLTVFHNGILIQYHADIKGPTTAYNKELPETATQGPLMLQDHNNEVSYRNIWLRELEL
ncbi:MAG: 3-keto-disaccharide hydrolase [Candidatus Cyclobacteriaceae bacterium M3_2C_046]